MARVQKKGRKVILGAKDVMYQGIDRALNVVIIPDVVIIPSWEILTRTGGEPSIWLPPGRHTMGNRCHMMGNLRCHTM